MNLGFYGMSVLKKVTNLLNKLNQHQLYSNFSINSFERAALLTNGSYLCMFTIIFTKLNPG